MTESHLLVIGTYRDVELSRQHPLSEVLAQLTRQPVFRRELLGRFDRGDIQRFVESATSVQPSQTLVETIYSHTDGNPFFYYRSGQASVGAARADIRSSYELRDTRRCEGGGWAAPQ